MCYGRCEKCFQIKVENWCKECNAMYFKQNFCNWTSKNKSIDKFIREAQLKTINRQRILEWIPYNRFENIEYLDKGGFSTVYKAIWLDGPIKEWSDNEKKWIRHHDSKQVALKSLHNSQNLSEEFLNEILYLKFYL